MFFRSTFRNKVLDLGLDKGVSWAELLRYKSIFSLYTGIIYVVQTAVIIVLMLLLNSFLWLSFILVFIFVLLALLVWHLNRITSLIELIVDASEKTIADYINEIRSANAYQVKIKKEILACNAILAGWLERIEIEGKSIDANDILLNKSLVENLSAKNYEILLESIYSEIQNKPELGVKKIENLPIII